MEMVDLNRAVEHVFPRHHQPQCVTHPPGRRLAHAKDLGEPDRGQALVRLEHQPHGFQPNTQGQLGRVQRVWVVVTVNWNRQSPLEH
jgi:hypothetical protein